MTKILLVEDDKSLREIYGVRLLAEGYDIVSAGDGEEALAMAIKERPALILSDVMMPKISGFDMLDILRSTTETKSIRVIMMTALSSPDQRIRGEELGADRYLVKSQVGIEDVVQAVHEVLEDRGGNKAAQPQSSIANDTQGQVDSFTLSSRNITSTTAPSVNIPPRTNPSIMQPAEQQPAPLVTPQWQTPQRQQSQQLSAPAPTPDSQQSTGLPQPTAPFSSQRPANLGERIIHPLSSNENEQPDVSKLMEQELNQSDAPQSEFIEPAPMPEPEPQPQPMPQPSVAVNKQPQPQQQPEFRVQPQQQQPQQQVSSPAQDTFAQLADTKTPEQQTATQPSAFQLPPQSPVPQPVQFGAVHYEETPRPVDGTPQQNMPNQR